MKLVLTLGLRSLLGTQGTLDLLDAFVTKVGKLNRVGAHGHWIALIELSSKYSRYRHAGGGNSLGKDTLREASQLTSLFIILNKHLVNEKQGKKRGKFNKTSRTDEETKDSLPLAGDEKSGEALPSCS